MNPVQTWLAQYPPPLSTTINRSPPEDILHLLQSNPSSIQIIDLRNDLSPARIKGSLNIPATSIQGPSDVYNKVLKRVVESRDNKVKVIAIHCNSSKNRATRVVGWCQDWLNSNEGGDLFVTVLAGGINGWLELGEEYLKYVEKVE